MKISISLPDDDVEFLDAYTTDHEMSSRSAVIHQAIRLLRTTGLGAAYEDAWDDWTASDEADAWEASTGDGVDR